jgi:dTDP-4-amino-4,6-dideoxygalactose transaminase
MQIPFSKIVCNENEFEYVKQVINSGWLTTANFCNEFEKKFAKYVGAKYACTVNSCTAALHLAAEALQIKAGDKVFVPSMTFTASAEILRYLNADPVFLDVEYGTTLLTKEILEEGIRRYPNVKAIIVVHYAGQPANMTELLSVCKKHNIKIIEDAAHAFPTKHNGKYIGAFGDATCFSFYANKTITTGEGGMITTENEELYKRIKIMRLHGINRDIWDRFTSNTAKWEYDVVAPGYKYNMPDINAAIGLAQLERAEELRYERQRCAEFYYSHLANVKEIDLPVINCKKEEHSWHLFPIVVNKKSSITRNEIIDTLAAKGIGISVHYKPLHRMTYYRNKYNLHPKDFPNTERIWQGNISFPIFPSMTEKELKYIVETIKDIFLMKGDYYERAA